MKLNNKMIELQHKEMNLPEEPSRTLNNFKSVIIANSREILKPTLPEGKKDWITDETLELMTERREAKRVDVGQ